MVHHKIVRSIFIPNSDQPRRLNLHAVGVTRHGSPAALSIARTSLKHAIGSAKLESVPMDAAFIVEAVHEATRSVRERRPRKGVAHDG